MTQKTPLAEVNDTFGGKDKLVDKLVGLLESDESKDDLRKRLLGVANRKLLRLHRVASTVKETYGSRDALVKQAAGTRAKDKDYVTTLEGKSTPLLVDLARQHQRRTGAVTAEGAPVKKARSTGRSKVERAKAKAAVAAQGNRAGKAAKVYKMQHGGKVTKKVIRKSNKKKGR